MINKKLGIKPNVTLEILPPLFNVNMDTNPFKVFSQP